MSDKVRELATRLGMLHSDCRNSSAEAFGATVENALRAELKPFVDAAKEAAKREQTHTTAITRLAAELQNWTARNPDGR